MKLIQNTLVTLATLALLGAPALALAHENEADADVDVSSSIGIAHPQFTSGVLFGGDGNVVVNGATVNSVGSTTITAQSKTGSSILNWILNTSSTSKISANGTTSNSTAGVKTGDTISFVGMLNSFGSTLTVSLDALRDWAPFSASTTASTSSEHGDKGKHLGWFKNWFHVFFSAGANAKVGADH